jgi:hypothetical protein
VSVKGSNFIFIETRACTMDIAAKYSTIQMEECV